MDALGVHATLEGLLSDRGARKRLARQVSIRLETLTRILDPAHPKRAGQALACRIAEVLVEAFGLPSEQASLVRDYLRYKSHFRLPNPSTTIPWERGTPDPYWLRRRVDDLVDLYRRSGAKLSPVRDPDGFRDLLAAFLHESRDILQATETWVRRPDGPEWIREGYMRTCALAGVAHAISGYLVEASVYTGRARRLALEMMAMPPPRPETARIQRANAIFSALGAPLVPLYLAGAYRRVAEGHARNALHVRELGRQWGLPDDLVQAWTLDAEMRRMHCLSGITRFCLGEVETSYRHCMRMIEQDRVLPEWFPGWLRTMACRRAAVYAGMGLGRAYLRYGSMRSLRKWQTYQAVLEDAVRLGELSLPLEVEAYGLLTQGYERQGDRDGARTYRDRMVRLARACGLQGYLLPCRPDAPHRLA